MAKIDALMTDPGPSVIYEDGFRNLIEDHITYLRNHPQTQVVTATSQQTYKYEFDLAGLLNELGITTDMHWIVMRMNHLTSPTHVPEDLTSILVPPQKEINILKQAYSTSKRA
jgi:hypothetical protein